MAATPASAPRENLGEPRHLVVQDRQGPACKVCPCRFSRRRFLGTERHGCVMTGLSMDAIAVGTVFQPNWDSRLHRILLMDHIEALYDVCWPHTNEWGFSKLDGEGQYYRIATPVLQNGTT